MWSRWPLFFLVPSLLACSGEPGPTTTDAQSAQATPPAQPVEQAGPPIQRVFTFGEPGDHGVGPGWKVYPDKMTDRAQLVDGVLELSAPTDGAGGSPKVCLEQPFTFSHPLQVTGEWKLNGVQGEKKWQGARILLWQINAKGRFKKGKGVSQNIVKGKGTAEWAGFSKSIQPMQDARLCLQLLQSKAGTVSLRKLTLTEEGATPAPTPAVAQPDGAKE